MRNEGIKVALAHAHTLRAELRLLADEPGALARSSGTPTPAMERLSLALDPDCSPLPEGSAQLKIDWRPVYAFKALAAGMGFIWLIARRQPKH